MNLFSPDDLLSPRTERNELVSARVVVFSSFPCVFLGLKPGAGELLDDLEFVRHVREVKAKLLQLRAGFGEPGARPVTQAAVLTSRVVFLAPAFGLPFGVF
ncbi:MAG: hypothetical protein M3Z23_14795 [Acidobacteriota bacterium]|nr:hypothetical protein [Acidobacteriota bacterium]